MFRWRTYDVCDYHPIKISHVTYFFLFRWEFQRLENLKNRNFQPLFILALIFDSDEIKTIRIDFFQQPFQGYQNLQNFCFMTSVVKKRFFLPHVFFGRFFCFFFCFFCFFCFFYFLLFFFGFLVSLFDFSLKKSVLVQSMP